MAKHIFIILLIGKLLFLPLHVSYAASDIEYGFDASIQHETFHHENLFAPASTVGVWVGYQGLKAYLWKDDFLHRGSKWRTRDIHYALDYTNEQNKFFYTCGIEQHLHICDRWSHADIYFSMGYASFLNPTLSFSKGIDQVYGSAIMLSLGHQWDKLWYFSPNIPMGLQINFNLTYGSHRHNEAFFDMYMATFPEANITFNFPIILKQNCILTPYVNAITFIDPAIRRQHRYERFTIFFGLNLSMNW